MERFTGDRTSGWGDAFEDIFPRARMVTLKVHDKGLCLGAASRHSAPFLLLVGAARGWRRRQAAPAVKQGLLALGQSSGPGVTAAQASGRPPAGLPQAIDAG